MPSYGIIGGDAPLGRGFGASGSRWKNTGGKHTGQDLKVPSGTNVFSPVNGKVTTVADRGNQSYGKYIVVRGDDGKDYYFAHLSAFKVNKGDGIAAGTQIGLSGASGNASGPHLHFEVREGKQSVDPLPYLQGSHTPVTVPERPAAVSGFDAEQVKNAQTIVNVGKKLGASDRDIQTALAASYVESNLRNVNHGDRDSLGLFQQRPSQGWGTPEQVTDPEYAATQFYTRLLKLPESTRANQGKAAQAVQRSAFPDRYGKKLATVAPLLQAAPTAAGGVPGTVAGGGVSTELDDDQLAAKYGYARTFFRQDPELWDLLRQAREADWTPEEFANRLQGSTWYKTHGAKDREWKALESTDPTEAKRQLQVRQQAVLSQARSAGVTLDPKRASILATDSLRFGWDAQTIQRAVADEYKYDPRTAATGKAATTVSDLKQLASQYLVPLSNSTLESWTRRVIAGETTPDDYRAYLQRQATSLFPELADQIASGQTVSDYLDPYRETAATQLGINPAEVDWLDPKWSQAVFQVDEKGKRSPMSLASWQTTLRKDPKYGYDQTAGAVQAGTQLGSAIAQAFGQS